MTPGTKLGPYEIVSRIGAGGMGEVYKARDTRLDRTVAIKISAAQFSDRFEREARAVAALNHPHICQLYDVGPNYLVMEYIDGRPLKGPMPVAEALALAVQMADALDAAHRKGIVHRDLKPTNVLLTKSGVKVLDFGLAKMVGASAGAMDATQTIAITKENTIIGTLQYMPPEQLQGGEADARSDIFAFGLVLYEMLTGKPAFEASSQASLIASILKDVPPAPSAGAPVTPAALDRVVTKCLAKDPDDRWQTARDLRDELAWLAGGGSSGEMPAPATALRNVRSRMGWWIAAAAILAAAGLAFIHLREKPEPARVVRFSVPPPPNARFEEFAVPAVSPDGEKIAFQVHIPGREQQQLWLLRLATGESRPLAGAEDAYFRCWSPDSNSLVVAQGGKIRRIDLASGAVSPFLDERADSLAWGSGGLLVFQTPGKDLVRIGADGSDRRVVTHPASGEFHAIPEFFPDGRQFLFLLGRENQNTAGEVWMGSVDGKPPVRMFATESQAVYASPGYLLFARGNTLMAQPFDSRRNAVRGPAVPLISPVSHPSGFSLAFFSASQNGVLAFRAGGAIGSSRLTWLDRSGKRLGTVGELADYSNPALSPDGKRLAVTMRDAQSHQRDIWIFDLVRGSKSKLTFDAADKTNPVWSPDGTRVAFTSDRNGMHNLYIKSAAGTGEDELLFESKVQKYTEDWSQDGRFLIFNAQPQRTVADLWVLPMAGAERKPVAFVVTPFNKEQARFSPDGRWIAYRSRESGRPEIFVQPYPPNGSKWQVSNAGGVEPQWRGDGKELFYYSGTGIMSVGIDAKGGAFEAGLPKPVLEVELGFQTRNRWVVTKDGQKFVAIVPGEDALVPFNVVVNWQALLEKR